LHEHTAGSRPVEAVQDPKAVRGRPPGCERVFAPDVVLEVPLHDADHPYVMPLLLG